MKKSILLFLVFTTTASAQNKNYLVTMDGIGAVKIGMSQDEIEKMLHQKFVLRNSLDSTAESYNDPATARYKDISLPLFFQRQYTENNNFFMYLIGMKTNSPLFKTENGIGVGSDKLKIISAYEANTISMGPEYEGKDFTIKSKTKYQVTIKSDDYKRQIIFYLRNKKVITIEVDTIFSDSE
jgi:hypothetical protein